MLFTYLYMFCDYQSLSLFLILMKRVKDGKYSLDGKLYQLSLNDFGNSMKHHVHGGFKSFDRLNWNTQLTDCGVIFSVLSEHASEVTFIP